MLFLHFRIFPEMMFFAGTENNQGSGGKGDGDFANTKMHSAPQTNRACASCAR